MITFHFKGKEEAFELSKLNNEKQIKDEIVGNEIHIADNLDFLKTNYNRLKNKIKCIYIDPPYNTGKDFLYKDKWKKGKECRHSKWLSFMYPRLILARELLSETGVIFVSIDDNEQANLKLMMTEIFGEENFVGCFIMNSAPAGTQSSNDIAQQHSYCLVFKKSDEFNSFKIQLSQKELEKKYYEKDEIGKYYPERLWKRGIGGKKEDVPSLHFSVYYDEKNNAIFIDDEIKSTDNLIEIIPYQTAGVLGRWTWSKQKMKQEKNKLIVKIIAGSYKLHKKKYLEEDEGQLIQSIINSNIARTELGSLEVKQIFDGKKLFDYPKPVSLIKHILKIATKPGDIILDFFAGSGTTGQAVMELNFEEVQKQKEALKKKEANQNLLIKEEEEEEKPAGGRKFILVQLPEKINEKKEAYKFCISNKLEPVISSITIERLKRAGDKYNSVDTGFKVFLSK
tara:strand:+ start:798 stop:2156 length:1359 start_codon:yes stop_codon:yes gene_type:complete